MSAFLTTHRLYLTPLSPIHIGCGEDFEPTNYVIDDGLLYGFDPSRAALNEMQRKELVKASHADTEIPLQQFFRTHAATFKPHSQVVIPVCKGVQQQYNDRIGKTANVETRGKRVANRLHIERHVYTGALQQPFIPGTSFKGALRTAWVDDLNAEQRPRENTSKSTTALEARLLGGDFQTSPLRLLKVADLMPQREPEREVLFAVNRKKREVIGKDGQAMQPKGIAARKDCVLHGQYRLFAADVTLPMLLNHVGATDHKGKPVTPQAEQLTQKGGVDLRRLARQSNEYHRQRLDNELNTLDGRGLVHPTWKRSVELLLSSRTDLGQKIAAGDAFLVRIGRYGSADSKTLTGEGVASIKIMGAKGSPPSFESTTKTVWLAAQTETDQKHLIPFGWAVVEIDPKGDSASLRDWCVQQNQGRPSMAELRTQLAAEREKAEQAKVEQAAQASARALAAEAERQAEAERAAALAQMTPQLQAVEKLRQACTDWADKLPPHGNFKKQEANRNKAGLYQDADKLVKTALASSDWNTAERTALANMLEQALPSVMNAWDSKKHRKELQLAKLRETV